MDEKNNVGIPTDEKPTHGINPNHITNEVQLYLDQNRPSLARSMVIKDIIRGKIQEAEGRDYYPPAVGNGLLIQFVEKVLERGIAEAISQKPENGQDRKSYIDTVFRTVSPQEGPPGLGNGLIVEFIDKSTEYGLWPKYAEALGIEYNKEETN